MNPSSGVPLPILTEVRHEDGSFREFIQVSPPDNGEIEDTMDLLTIMTEEAGKFSKHFGATGSTNHISISAAPGWRFRQINKEDIEEDNEDRFEFTNPSSGHFIELARRKLVTPDHLAIRAGIQSNTAKISSSVQFQGDQILLGYQIGYVVTESVKQMLDIGTESSHRETFWRLYHIIRQQYFDGRFLGLPVKTTEIPDNLDILSESNRKAHGSRDTTDPAVIIALTKGGEIFIKLCPIKECDRWPLVEEAMTELWNPTRRLILRDLGLL